MWLVSRVMANANRARHVVFVQHKAYHAMFITALHRLAESASHGVSLVCFDSMQQNA
jgi:hypothetical protein